MPIPSESQIRRPVQLNVMVGHVLVWMFVLGALAALVNPLGFQWDDHPTWLWLNNHPVLCAWLLSVAFGTGLLAHSGVGSWNVAPLDKAGSDLLGPYKTNDIKQMFLEIRATFKAQRREKTNCSSTVTPIPGSTASGARCSS